jgi:hypothetical protein
MFVFLPLAPEWRCRVAFAQNLALTIEQDGI